MQGNTSFWASLYRQLASLKFTVFILLFLAISSLIGTLLPQGMGQEELTARFGPNISRLIEFFGLNDLYHAGWFRFLLLLLTLNLTICTLERLPKTLKLLRFQEQKLDPQKLLKFNQHKQFTSPLLWKDIQPALEQAVSRRFGSLRRLESSGELYSATAERGRWSLLMVYVVHLSVIVVLLGALIGSIFGFKGFMNIPEGRALNEAHLSSGHSTVSLPFEVRCDRFDVSFYDNGTPKDYVSDLTILENGQEVLKRSIRVNDPLSYKGVTFYQASYGATLKQAKVELRDMDSDKTYQMVLPLGESQTIPGTADQIQVVRYQENFSRMGPALAIVVMRDGSPPEGSWILADIPDFHGNMVRNYRIEVQDVEQTRFTGLQVKRDPGVWVVWLGFTAMIVGITLTFYGSHRKLWVWASAGNPTTKIILAGKASKSSLAFEREFQDLVEQLQNDLKAGKRG